MVFYFTKKEIDMPNRLVNTDLWNDENIIENFTAEELKAKLKELSKE